ncbi:SCP2 domain-containing protein [Pseudomonas neustonica]|uniref:Ubiquinone biosynthesis accessory factor UbiJ n=1 Tax=Pseudomonas neustonica TaxID=2487346 RepID=A0ABX9XI49_9PSED|nr:MULTISPECIES: SCP2 sterol-binding domain-containing protein [Pseudomonas]ROZ81651.1 SCP2 domain-containing protein [Pseudomonas sp. SSM44]ROZ83353.1 SCP2 domain-containing protein [Pseudomonas neustonica]|tara:strand:- start:390 stop:1013 length:624 start_codon:yes stop_codon:yes gene_type:complete
MLPAALLTAAQRSIEAALKRDTLTATRLGALSGKVILITAREPAWQLYLLPTAGSIQLLAEHTGDADCQLSAPSAALAKLLISSDRKALMQDPELALTGDSQVLITLQNIISDLKLDGEAELQRWLGPVPAHAIGSLLRRSHQWGKDSRESLRLTLGEYLTEESRQLVGKAEARASAELLHEMRLQLDRLEARVALLNPTDPDTPDA